MRYFLFLLLLLASLILYSCSHLAPLSTWGTPREPIIELTSTLEEPTPTIPQVKISTTHFTVNDKLFQFVGAFVIDWEFSQESANQLISSAKLAGLDVLTLMLPYSGNGIGDEFSLSQLDIFLDQASVHGVRVIVTLVQGLSIAIDKTHPLYNPGGVAGLIHDDALKSAYMDLIERVVTHVNTVNGKRYVEDPTIMAWDLITEPIPSPIALAPPGLTEEEAKKAGQTNLTTDEFGSWVTEMVRFTKNIDPNHLVTMCLTGSVTTIKDWPLAIKELDFLFIDVCIYDILYVQNLSLDDDYLETNLSYPIFSIGKPVVPQLAFTSGWLEEKFAANHELQGQIFKEALDKGFKSGVAGATIFSWGTKNLVLKKGNIESLYLCYDASDKEIIDPILEIASRLSRN